MSSKSILAYENLNHSKKEFHFNFYPAFFSNYSPPSNLINPQRPCFGQKQNLNELKYQLKQDNDKKLILINNI